MVGAAGGVFPAILGRIRGNFALRGNCIAAIAAFRADTRRKIFLGFCMRTARNLKDTRLCSITAVIFGAKRLCPIFDVRSVLFVEALVASAFLLALFKRIEANQAF